MTAERPVIRIRSLTKSFGALRVLKGVDLDVRRGEVVSLIGASGSGKSTLLRCINGLEDPESGLIEVDGALMGRELRGGRIHEIPPRRARAQRAEVGMVFQSFHLFGHRTVLENVMLAPRHVRRVSRDAARSSAMEQLERVGLADKAGSYPRQLSGGQQQRVAIARALCMRPTVMLFDEPTSALDPELVGEVLDVIKGIAADGATMIIVTHELAFARDVSDQVVFLHNGSILESGAPEAVLGNPQQDRTREFLQRYTGAA
ncbi:ATP-binding cassette domain-containing protein [Nakamurella sp. YIM 132087]|uniref:ABC-type polar-amino-acid transporter n=1 Tax=Nakamurella alba TaxID=2665158 RepID=A0A7K1FTW1_9ACTN|nr:amino acid ABC transporter ATP-binding protein [Nakamurella alba]MTD17520.1 ATP-binding cassette domain-containing protein [Nakamurella alba]